MIHLIEYIDYYIGPFVKCCSKKFLSTNSRIFEAVQSFGIDLKIEFVVRVIWLSLHIY